MESRQCRTHGAGVGVRGSGAPLISPFNGHFIGGPEYVKILGVQGVLCMWQLVYASCHA